MTKENSFKLSYPHDKRVQSARTLRDKYPSKIPVICEVGKKSALELDKNRYLVPSDITLGQFQFTIRNRIPNLDPADALYMFINNSLVPMTALMSAIYEEKKEIDGFLYIVINTESTFGN